MKYPTKLSSIFIAALSATIMMVGVASATSATLRVTNDGADSATCGAPTQPCRTISQAIENAADGDSIEVGAGMYGNVSGDPNFAGPGDEHAQMGNFPSQGCIICITKGVHIYSLHGAAVTIIQSIPSAFPSTVMIQSDGVTFGQAGGGFTLTGGNANGVILDMNVSDSPFGMVLKRNVTIAGNVDVGDGSGFVFNGFEFEDRLCPVPSCISNAQITFSDNESINNGAGFSVTVNTWSGGIVTFRNNLAQGGGTGFFVDTGAQDEDGLSLGAGDVVLLGNVASHNGFGYNLTLVGRTENNTATGNSQAGFMVVPSGTFRGNSALGNAGPGIMMNYAANLFSFSPLTNNYSPFIQNNFYGNDRNRPVLSVFFGAPNPGPSAHCGVLNLGDEAAAVMAASGRGGLDPQTLQAGDNFWGSAHGPATSGVGDAVGGVCDQNAATTIAKPFATEAFAITAWP